MFVCSFDSAAVSIAGIPDIAVIIISIVSLAWIGMQSLEMGVNKVMNFVTAVKGMDVCCFVDLRSADTACRWEVLTPHHILGEEGSSTAVKTSTLCLDFLLLRSGCEVL